MINDCFASAKVVSGVTGLFVQQQDSQAGAHLSVTSRGRQVQTGESGTYFVAQKVPLDLGGGGA